MDLKASDFSATLKFDLLWLLHNQTIPISLEPPTQHTERQLECAPIHLKPHEKQTKA